MHRLNQVFSVVGVAALAASSQAAVTITLGTSALTYTGQTLNFDEPGTPTGMVPISTWQASHGVAIEAGTGNPGVDAYQTSYGAWLGTGKAVSGPFGLFMRFDTDLSGLSMQVWDPSGNPTPFGGGMSILAFDDGVEVASRFVSPAWGGTGNSWVDFAASGGQNFDEVRVLGFGFSPTTFADNMSWNLVPAPGALAMLGLAGTGACRRRSR